MTRARPGRTGATVTSIDAFREFFVASAGVAGALVGLLFVAVSVVPHAVRTSSKATDKLRPSSALSAFTNALIVSLLALIPGLRLAGVLTALSIAGLVAMAGLLVLLAREIRTAKPVSLLTALVAIVSQGVVYGFQLAQGIALQDAPDDMATLDRVAVIIVVLFALGIERAWEYVGASTPSLLATALGSTRRAATDAAAAPDPAAPDPAAPDPAAPRSDASGEIRER